jgi:hypothetical protein
MEELLADMPELEKPLQEGINGVLDWIIDRLDIIGMLHLNVMKRDLGICSAYSIGCKGSGKLDRHLGVDLFSVSVMSSRKVT